MDVVSLLSGILVGAVLVAAPIFVWAQRQLLRRFDEGRASRDGELAQIAARAAAAEAALNEARAAAQSAAEARAALAARMEEAASAHAEKLRWIESAREQLAQQFQALASAVLEQKAERFGAANAEQVGSLMAPLREQLRQFQQLVVESRAQEGESRAVLRTEIQHLRQLNERLSGDAVNLARALTGDTKTQGAWGELVLERLLEASGLSEGRDYDTQVVLRDEGSETRRPDVVVRLPGGRDVLIDAKVSLVAFERWCNDHDPIAREKHLAEHLGSMRRHIDDLGKRGYARSSGVASNGIVLMFVPIEAAYLEAIRVDPKLYELALRNDVVVVSPGMLLGVLRTIDHVWKAEARRRNAEQIAERAGLLYDKFVGFVQDLQRASEQVGRARSGIDEALSKLSVGKGNLVGQVEKLRSLGARNNRELREVLPIADNGTDAGEGEAT